MIKSYCLNHGMGYTYRYRVSGLNGLASNGFSSLREYLSTVGEFCPESFFISGPRSSSLKLNLGINLDLVEGHKMSKLAEHALKNYLGTPHDRVQLCALDNDSSAIAVEVPVWIKPADLTGVGISEKIINTIFSEGELLTGHIDLLEIDGNNIWIWDFKPHAEKEKHAATQVMMYALMLSKRTRINLSKFRCGYFDEKRAYLFRPSMELLREIV